MKTGFLPYYVKSQGPFSPSGCSQSRHFDLPSSHFLTASYDGNIRCFDYAQAPLHTFPAHNAPITSISVIPSASTPADSHLIASASHDLTANLTLLTLPPLPDVPASSKSLATLHLHVAPLSSVQSSPSGAHLLTSSWDGLIGLWDTTVPVIDQVPLDHPDGPERKRLRKGPDASNKPKRKAPIAVLKSHTARVSKAVFGRDNKVAYSCGFDSTVRMWDVENGLCTNTIVRVFFFLA